jgi:hypothetical protein
VEKRKPKSSKGKADLQRLDAALSELEQAVGEIHRAVRLMVEAWQGPLPEGPEEAEADADDELGGD